VGQPSGERTFRESDEWNAVLSAGSKRWITADASEVWLSAILGGDRMRLIPLMGGTPRPFLSEHAMEAAWSPDGSQIVFHPYDAGDAMFIVDRTGANPRQIFKLDADGHNHFQVWSKWSVDLVRQWALERQRNGYMAHPA
jgi:hypothetical protein